MSQNRGSSLPHAYLLLVPKQVEDMKQQTKGVKPLATLLRQGINNKSSKSAYELKMVKS